MEKARKYPLIGSFDGLDQVPICRQASMGLKIVGEAIKTSKELTVRSHPMGHRDSALGAHLLVRPSIRAVANPYACVECLSSRHLLEVKNRSPGIESTVLLI